MTVTEIAQAIHRHLSRFAADPKIASSKWTDTKGVEREISLYWHPNCSRGGACVMVRYVSYQFTSSLTKAEAEKYLAWLDAGNIGRHYEALKETADV